MGLGQIVKDTYSKSASYVKKEHTFVTASVLASVACITDAITTKISIGSHTFLTVREANNFTAYLMNNFGVGKVLALESILTVSLAVPLAFTLNKIMREEWKPGNYLKEKLGIKKSKEGEHKLPNLLKRDFGTSYFYALSVASIYAAYNNVYIYYMIKGLVNTKTHLPFLPF